MNVVDQYSTPVKTPPSLRPVRTSLPRDVLLGGALARPGIPGQ